MPVKDLIKDYNNNNKDKDITLNKLNLLIYQLSLQQLQSQVITLIVINQVVTNQQCYLLYQVMVINNNLYH